MPAESLSQLASETFLAEFLNTTNPAVIHARLQRHPYVKRLRSDLKSNVINEKSLQRFCDELLKGFQPGVRFWGELALAAIGVALETRPTEFAESYLDQLAGLSNLEMPLAIRVARESRKARENLTETESVPLPVKTFPPKRRRVSFSDEEGQRRVRVDQETRQLEPC